MKPRLVPGRWPPAALAAGGVLLALPTLIWPVLVFTHVSPAEADFAAQTFVQGIWGWGKFADLSEPVEGTPFEMSNTPSLVLLVVSLAIGAVGVVARAFVGREPGRSAGIAGATFLTAAQLAFAAQWLSQWMMSGQEVDASNQVALQPAGWLQLASVVLLVVSLGFMLWRPMRVCLAPTWGRLQGAEPESEPTAPDVDAPRPSSTPLGSARLREADAGGEPSRPVDGPAVGFSDRGRDRDRGARGSEPFR